MTNEQIRQLTIMRREGAGYGTIADALHLSINTVKSWCRRHHLPDGTRPASGRHQYARTAASPSRRFQAASISVSAPTSAGTPGGTATSTW